jgi:hypothetical protein
MKTEWKGKLFVGILGQAPRVTAIKLRITILKALFFQSLMVIQ